jgi:hypothetical protein
MQHLYVVAIQLLASDPIPEDDDVVAGWIGFAVFIGLAIAVALLGWGLTKQLRRAEANRKAGAFGPVEDDEPVDPEGERRD